jgi:hypothetical protein
MLETARLATDKRRKLAMEVRAELVRVDWLVDGNDNLRTARAVLEDISALGACVQMEERISPGTAISISAVSEDAAPVSGHVTYCIYRDYGYFAGISFSKETARSRPVFEPQRLTNQMLSPPARQ